MDLASFELTAERPTVRDWAIGVTTAPRKTPTLEHALTSLAAAGWDRPRLFAEPGTEIPSEFADLPITRRDEVLGAFPNWYLGLAELVMRAPRAAAYFMCQDDVLFSQGLRSYLEDSLWPGPDTGVVSIYCPSHYGLDQPPGFHAENRGWHSWGALAYIFPPGAARAILSDKRVLEHRLQGPGGGARNIDSVVGRWCRDVGKEYFVHVPSLAQHIGETSTIWGGTRNASRRRADRFLERIGPDTPELSPATSVATANIRLDASERDDPLQFPAQAWRFITALTRHAADGLRQCSQAEVEERLAICRGCRSFLGDRCAECGCHCNDQRVFLNKLAWRSEACPLRKW